MSIVRAGMYSAVAAGARLISGLLIIKLVALFAGPAGVGKLGQFMSVMSLLAVFAGGGIANGITKYVAEHRSGLPAQLASVVRSGITFSLASSVVVGISCLVFSGQIAIWLLGDVQYEPLVWVLALSQAMVAVHAVMVAIINGHMDFRRVAMVHLLGAVVSVGITALLSWQFQLYGALLALIIGQAAGLLISFPLAWRGRYVDWSLMRLGADLANIRKLLRYSVMTLTSALLPPVVSIWIRNHLAERFSWEQVGYWQAVSKLSEAYLLVVTMAISMYYLPKLASIHDRPSFRSELRSAYLAILPLVIGMAATIYLLRDILLVVLFSREFLEASSLFLPQLIGDVIKIAAYLQSYVMVAKALMVPFLVTELVFSFTYVLAVGYFVDRFGLVGAMYAFAVNYAVYWLFVLVVSRQYVKGMPLKVAQGH